MRDSIRKDTPICVIHLYNHCLASLQSQPSIYVCVKNRIRRSQDEQKKQTNKETNDKTRQQSSKMRGINTNTHEPRMQLSKTLALGQGQNRSTASIVNGMELVVKFRHSVWRIKLVVCNRLERQIPMAANTTNTHQSEYYSHKVLRVKPFYSTRSLSTTSCIAGGSHQPLYRRSRRGSVARPSSRPSKRPTQCRPSTWQFPRVST